MGSTDKFYLTTKWVFSNNRNTLIELSRNGIQIAPIKEDYYSYYSLKRKYSNHNSSTQHFWNMDKTYLCQTFG